MHDYLTGRFNVNTSLAHYWIATTIVYFFDKCHFIQYCIRLIIYYFIIWIDIFSDEKKLMRKCFIHREGFRGMIWTLAYQSSSRGILQRHKVKGIESKTDCPSDEEMIYLSGKSSRDDMDANPVEYE